METINKHEQEQIPALASASANSSIIVGDWKFYQNDDGDLVVVNTRTSHEVIVIRA